MNPQLGQRLFSIPDPNAVGLTANETVDAMYSLTADPEQEALMMEPVSLAVMDSAYIEGEPVLSGLVLDAISTTYARFPRTMKALERSLNRGGLDAGGIQVSGHEIGAPKKNNLFATVAVQFTMTDGQALTVIFHAPDEDPKIFKPDDMVVAFRWMLNKRDITQVVTPEMVQGKMRDVSLQSVAKRVASLVVANSEKFKAKQTEVLKMKETLGETNKEVDALTEELQSLTADISDLNERSEEMDQLITLKSGKLTETEQRNEELRAQIAELKAASKVEPTSQNTPEGEAGARLKLIDSDLHRDITGSMSTIAAIDQGGALGNDRALFVSSIVNKIKTRHKNGQTETVDAALDYIKETQAKLDKPLITDRNGVWKLHSNSTGTIEENELESMIGRKWDSKDGQKAITGVQNGQFVVEAAGMAFPQLIDPEHLERTIQVDEANYVSPEKQQELDLEKQKEAEAALAEYESTYPKVNEYLAVSGKTPALQAKAKASLETLMDLNGEVKSRAYHVVHNLVPNYELSEATGTGVKAKWIRKDDPSIFIDGLTKTEADFAKWLGITEKGEENTDNAENSEKPESVLTLENIINGLHDDVAADDILEMIEEAVEQLEEKGLIEQYDALIGSATEKYAELDEKQE